MRTEAGKVKWDEGIEDLLIVLRALCTVFIGSFGNPARIVQKIMTHPMRKDFVFSLQGLERVARRLVFLMAARVEFKMPEPKAPPKSSPASVILGQALRQQNACLGPISAEVSDSANGEGMDSRDKPENDCVGGAILGAKQPAKDPDWENSQTWRLGFSIPTPAFFKRRSRRKIEPVRSGYWNADKGPLWVRDPLPLARRLEAIIRVMENPAPYAIRLARRLEKLKRTNMGPELLIKSLLKMPAMPTRMDQLRPAGLSALQESQALAREAAAHFRGSG